MKDSDCVAHDTNVVNDNRGSPSSEAITGTEDYKRSNDNVEIDPNSDDYVGRIADTFENVPSFEYSENAQDFRINEEINVTEPLYVETILDVSISMTVLLLFTPLRNVIRTKSFHPCFVEHLNFNIPKSARIHSMINSLCDNAFKIAKDNFNTFGLAAMGYDLFFFQDQILDDDYD